MHILQVVKMTHQKTKTFELELLWTLLHGGCGILGQSPHHAGPSVPTCKIKGLKLDHL